MLGDVSWTFAKSKFLSVYMSTTLTFTFEKWPKLIKTFKTRERLLCCNAWLQKKLIYLNHHLLKLNGQYNSTIQYKSKPTPF